MVSRPRLLTNRNTPLCVCDDINILAPGSAASVTMEKAKRQIIANKLRTGEKPAAISQQLGVTERRVYKVQALIRDACSLSPALRTGRRRIVWTKERIAAINAAVKRNPRVSINRLAKKRGMARTTVQRIIREDLGLNSRVVQPRPSLMSVIKEKRLERAAGLLNRLKGEDKGIFCDEKIFTKDA